MSRQYPFPWQLLIGLARSLPSGRRSLQADSNALVACMHAPLDLRGVENIPTAGPAIVAVNHFQQRGLWIGWTGAAVTVGVESRRHIDPPVHWLVTGGLRCMQWKNAGPEVPGTARLFRRVAHTYGMVPLPLADKRRRASAVRSWLRIASSGRVVGIFPEGVQGHGASLGYAEPGFSTICRLAARAEISIIPCGVTGGNGTLAARFGSALRGDTLLQSSDAADDVMRAIAALLPATMRGPYALSVGI